MTATIHWDEAFPLLRLDGVGARDFLQGQTTADLSRVAAGVLELSCWLTATGRLRALLELRFDGTGADVLVLAGDAQAVSRGFDQVIFPADRVRLVASGRQRRVQGFEPAGSVWWLEEEQPLPDALVGSTRLENDALERHRLQQGFPPGPAEMNGETNPLELGLSGQISLDKGCYLGQETMAKLAGKAGVKQQLRCWISDQPLQPGDQLRVGTDRAGSITSALSHATEGTFGLALVRRQFLDLPTLSGPTGQAVQLSQPAAFQAPPA